MKPVFQSRVHKTLGDCVSACVASLLHLPLDEVPNFMEAAKTHGELSWYVKFCHYMAEHGHLVTGQSDNGEERFFGVNGYTTAVVDSQVFKGATHCVVIEVSSGEVVHDPNPDNRPYRKDEIKVYDVIVPFMGSPDSNIEKERKE